MRAVLDPNVLVSAVLSRRGTPASLLRAWLTGAYELVVSPALLSELNRVLAYPKIAKRISLDDATDLLRLLQEQATTVDDADEVPTVRSPDPHDDYLISVAATAAALLVSGDTDLLGLRGQIPVYTPAEFREILDRTQA